MTADCLLLRGLPRHSREEVALLNAAAHLFSSPSQIAAAVENGLANLLEVKTGALLHILQKNEIERSEVRRHTFEKAQIAIGRADDNDIVLSLGTIGKQHARIQQRGGKFYLQDLGIAIGTYLNDRRLNPLEPVGMQTGDRFLIFPYSFVCEVEERWEPGPVPRFHFSAPTPTTRSEFRSASPSFAQFEAAICPSGGSAGIAIQRGLLETVIAHLTRSEIAPLASSHTGIIEFALLSVLEELNRSLQFPYQFLLQPAVTTTHSSERGIAVELCLQLSGRAGVVRVFFPQQLLDEFHRIASRKDVPPAFASLPTLVPVSVGHVDLSMAELATLEAGDILLFAKQPSLLLPHGRSWLLKQLSDTPFRLLVERFSERSELMPQDESSQPEQLETQEPAVQPKLEAIPVRIHIILREIELTLAELSALSAGSILELEGSPADPVRLALNGKIAGSGELIDIEGKLGVRISAWSQS
jgi:type III secretion system YscQ/HrcQ family protein